MLIYFYYLNISLDPLKENEQLHRKHVRAISISFHKSEECTHGDGNCCSQCAQAVLIRSNISRYSHIKLMQYLM